MKPSESYSTPLGRLRLRQLPPVLLLVLLAAQLLLLAALLP